MEVPVSTLRAEIKTWIAKAREGESVVITERGVPIARLMPVDGAELIEELERDGLLTAPARVRAAAPEHKVEPAQSSTGLTGLVRKLRR
jgi:prevent-host-death family protein